MAGTLANLRIGLTIDRTRLRASIAGAKTDISTGLRGAGMSGAASLSKGLIGGASVVGLAMAAWGTKVAMGFDQAMTESLAIMSDVSGDMRKEMELAAREVGRTTTFSSTQAAESYYFLASAGLSAEAQIAAMPKVAAFAQAGMFDMAQATDYLTDAQSALGLTVRDDAVKNMENMVRVSDVLVKANQSANASVELFSKSLTSGAGPALRAIEKDIEEGVAVLAAFADQGIKGELAGNALDRILRLLPSAAVKNADAYKRMGVEVYDSTGKMKNMADIVEDLENALGGLSDREKQVALEALGFQARVQGVIKPLLGMSDAIRDYEAQYRSAGGATETVAAKQLESVKSQLGLFMAELEDIALTLGQALLPVLTDMLGIVKPIVAGFGNMLRSSEGLVKALAPMLTMLMGVGALKFGKGLLGMMMPMPMGMGGGKLGGAWSTMGRLAGKAFGIGFAAIAVVELWNQFNKFNEDVGAAQARLAEQAEGALEQSGREAINNLENLTKHMNEAQGLTRIIGDTWGGKEQMEGLKNLAIAIRTDSTLFGNELERAITLLTKAEEEALARGNEGIARELATTKKLLESRALVAPAYDPLSGASYMTEPAAVQAPAVDVQPTINNAGRALAGARAQFRSAALEALEPFVTETQAAWDHVQGILNGAPPKIIPMEQRMKQIGKAMRTSYKQLNKAVKQDDPVAAAYWEQQLLTLKNEQNTFKNATTKSWAAVKKDLDAAGINHARFTGKWKKAKAMLAIAEKKKSKELARATPEALAAKQAELETVMSKTEAIIADPLKALPTKAESWGSTMGSMFVAGIRSQVSEAQAAAEELAAAAALPLETGSPPKAGPLKNIDKWGGPLVDTWVAGIRKGRNKVRRSADDLARGFNPQPALATAGAGGRGNGGGGVHIHVGTLIADDRGIDELQRRMSRRLRIGNRTRWTENEFN